MFLPSGTRLGPYTVTALIGTGGMGEVYKATDTRLSRTVAIKVLGQHIASDPEQQQRFRREAKAISSLNHPHVCALYDIGTQDDAQFLVMEYVEGETLAQRLAGGALPLKETLRFASEMADALEAAHSRGIVHRDFKPANVTITPEGAVKLLDFGIAKVVADLGTGAVANKAVTMMPSETRDGAVIGTTSYMSPEQARGMPVDHRTDIWAFGCVLFEMLTGSRAFDAETAADTTVAILEREPNLTALPASTPAAARRLVQRCFDKDAATRLPRIGEAAIELRRALTELDARAQERPPSIAVLPFANMSADPDNEYFSDGLAEEILNALTEIRGLRVIARTSAFAFKGKNEDIRRIAEALDVSTILEGSVRKAGNRIRVTAQLIQASDGSHLWSKRYDRELADIFAVQDEIAAAIADALRVTIGPQAVEGRKPTTNLEAYDAFLKGEYHFRKSTKEGFARSEELFRHAITLDPSFALAHYGLGRNLFLLYTAAIVPPHDVVHLIKKHAEDALNHDPSLPEAHALLGALAALYDYDWAEADRRFRLASARHPLSIEVLFHRMNFFLAHVGRAEEGLDELARARADDPLNASVIWVFAVALRAARRDAEADALFREAVDMNVGYLSSISAVVLAGGHVARSELKEALPLAETAHARHPQAPWAIGQYAGVLARLGELERSEAMLDQLRPGTAFGAPFGLALAALSSGKLNEAADWLEKAIAQRDLWVSFLLNVGNLGGRLMWSSPRWPRLAALMKLPPSRMLRS